MTSGRSGARLLWPDDGRFALRIVRKGQLWEPLGETQMRKISLLAVIALMLAGVGVWASVKLPANAQINPSEITLSANHPPVAQHDDQSVLWAPDELVGGCY